MRLTLFFSAIILAGVIGTAVSASAQGGQNCDAIKDDDAFNKCLAASGPTRRAPSANPPPISDKGTIDSGGRASAIQYGPLRRARESAQRSRAHANRWHVQRLHGGRLRMVIPVNRRKR